MEMVKNEIKYWNFILKLRNDEQIKKGFISQEEISSKQHENFMLKNSENYFICLIDEVPVGFVGCVNNDIRFAVSSEHQGKGVGKFMISFISNNYPDGFAKVKIENHASLKCFTENGFKIKYYLLELENENKCV